MLFQEVVQALLEILGKLLVGLLILRFWALAIGMPARNPLARFAHTLTDWLVRPLTRVIPARGRVDWAALVAAIVVVVLFVVARRALFGLPLPADVLVIGSLLLLVNWSLTLVIWVTLIYVIISWVNPLAPVAPALSMLLRPMLAPIRRVLPAISGIDLSPMVLLIVIYLLQMVVGRLAF